MKSMEEFLKEYATFRQLLKAAVQGLDEDVVVNLYAVYRKDVCRARMDAKESGAAQRVPGKPAESQAKGTATDAQLNVLWRMHDEGALPAKYAPVINELTKQEASELISKFGTKRSRD